MSRHYAMPIWDSLLGRLPSSDTPTIPGAQTGSALNTLADFDFDRDRAIALQRQSLATTDFGRRMARYDQEIDAEQLSAEALRTSLGREQMTSQDQFMFNEMQQMVRDTTTGRITTESVYPRHETMSGDSRVDPESKDLLIYDGGRWVTVSHRKADEHHISIVEESIVNLKYALEEMEAQSRDQQALRQHVNPDVIEDITDDEFKDLI